MTNNFSSIRYWNTQTPGFVYPELDQSGPLCYTPILNRPNSGICVSGGGSVSASLIAGYYAALNQLGVMSQLRYISGVSGGTWGSAPFVFKPAGNNNFSGDTKLPADITVDHLQATTNGSMQNAATHADIVDKSLELLTLAVAEGTPTNRIYERAVGANFLNSVGIHSPANNILQKFTDRPEDAQFFSSTATAVADVQQRNPGLKNKFMTMGDDMPFIIMNATMFVPVTPEGGKTYNYICPVEVTPLYTGIKNVQNTHSGSNIGGFYVESFGFNTTLTGTANGVAQATGTYPFELCQPVGASGSALEEMLEKYAPELLRCFPQFNYWNPLYPQEGTRQYDFGDGGCIEDSGVTPLLGRGVQNIAMFLTEPVFFPDTDVVGCPGFGERVFGYNQVACLFGAPLIDGGASTSAGQVVYIQASSQKQVFDNAQFAPLMDALLQARTNGGPMVLSMQMTVVANSLFGITPAAGYQPQVIWSIVETSTSWNQQLREDVSSWIKTQPDLADFPEVKVFGQNKWKMIKLTAPQANLLADMGYWMVMSNKDLFTSVLAQASVPLSNVAS